MESKEDELLRKYQEGTCTPEEKALVESWYLREAKAAEDQLPEPDYAQIRDEIWNTLPPNRTVRIIPLRRIAAAASILLLLSAGGYFLLHKKAPPQIAQNQQHDIAPGHNQATLTLANGQKIILTKNLTGQLAVQGNTKISVNAGNAIAYDAGQTETAVSYNTLSTARGEQSPYPLVLPDGTQVWLNAASSITFPTAFTGTERKVTVTGEAYVIVAHNAKQPFKLIAGNQTIDDIGTEFNINAYSDEPVVTTTLAAGSIKVTKEDQSVLIRPGEKATSSAKNNQLSVSKADLESALAWKNGKFDFSNADVPSVMRQISRWYNVDVVYEGGVPNAAINGSVYRNTNASNALKIVKLLGIPYRIEGRKIIITNTQP